MFYKYEYETDVDRKRILEENKHLSLIEEQNILDGNFLIFSETPNFSVNQEIED
ncbi:hypothetical protein [Sporosarcina sp. UB5]|uniref:hypothetical protein n=1 Tax=Sporosarcina sp. UB5 TaxID=3047463 RepID=UPI003D7BC6A5